MELIKADLHNHLKTGRWIKEIDPSKVIDKVNEKLGHGGALGIINYRPSQRYEEFVSCLKEDTINLKNAVHIPIYNLTFIKGEEINVKLPKGGQADLLVLGLNSKYHIGHGKRLDDVIKEVKDNGALIGADHPFHIGGIGPFLKNNQDYLHKLDFLEIYNGECSLWLPGYSKSNQKAQEFFDSARDEDCLLKNTLGKLVSSDGHSIKEIGSNWMELPILDLHSQESLILSLKKGMILAASSPYFYDKRNNNSLDAINHMIKWVYVKVARKVPILPQGSS